MGKELLTFEDNLSINLLFCIFFILSEGNNIDLRIIF